MKIFVSIGITCMLLLLTGCEGKNRSLSQVERVHEDMAHQLFRWNEKNLVHTAHFEKEDLEKFLAPEFVVKANDRSFTGNRDSYFEFLNSLRKNIESLEYDLQDSIASRNKVVIPLRTTLVFTDGKTQIFDSIAILGFDESGKINLLHEVYSERAEEGV